MTKTVDTYNRELLFNLPEESYFAEPRASNSALTALRRSPRHLQWLLSHPKEPTPAMRLGTAFHVATLEPEVFAKEWVRNTELSGRTKEGREAKAELMLEYEHHKILKPADYDTVQNMTESVMAHPLASAMLEGTDKEVAAYWTDPKSGIECKARIDALRTTDDGFQLIDLKSTIDSSASYMQKAMYNLGYYRQCAHYLSPFVGDGQSDENHTFHFICCEKTPPFGVQVFELSQSAIDYGRIDVQLLLQEWSSLLDEYGFDETWPGYPEETTVLNLPGFVR